MQEAVDLLHPLLTDTVDIVKQGALIATALVLMQQPESKVRSMLQQPAGNLCCYVLMCAIACLSLAALKTSPAMCPGQ